MVQDPRVTTTLARLGGVYRDPARVDRDASSLLKSSVGNLLRPIAAELFEDNGTSNTVLVLQGTIAIHFRGNTYQLLVDIYLPAGYPNRPPICFVRLADNMYLKENHRHVGSDGKVYLPYLHEWRPQTHNLVELVVAMSSVFSNDPPVFSSRAGAAANAASSSASTAATISPTVSASQSTPYSMVFSRQQHQQQQSVDDTTSILAARERADTAAAMEASRLRAIAEEEERAKAAQREWEVQRTRQVRDTVAQKIHRHLVTTSTTVHAALQADWKDTQRLATAQEKVQQQLALYRKKVADLERQCVVAEESKSEIQVWLAEHEQASNNGDKNMAMSVDDMVQPASKLHGQMLDLSAENAAISDALYFLDRALYLGHLDLETHLKQVRLLAKRQFLVRAHLIKIHQAYTMNIATVPNANSRSFAATAPTRFRV